MSESALVIDCAGDPLVAILHRSEGAGRRGILVVVGGGPQYRVGGHRQLTLWSRFLSAHGYPVLRFDYRGMGDSHGDFRGFENADLDIRLAIDRFMQEVPELEEVVLWGECDAASAILFYAYRDKRVKGVVLLNPWVRTEAGEAKAILRFYYLNRLMQPSFWRKVFSLRFNPLASMGSAARLVLQSRASVATASTQPPATESTEEPIARHLALPERLLLGLQRFNGPVMLVLSGRDLIAREFDTVAKASPAWQHELQRKPVTRHDLPDGDHTFSSELQRSQVVRWGLDWIRAW